MARVTVEDCAEVVPNRFQLVAVASQRARAIASGGEITVEKNNDKNVVIALREIADKTIDAEKLLELLVQSCQKKVKLDEYGVEEVQAKKEQVIDGKTEEVLEEMTALQDDVKADEKSDDLLYGGDDIQADD